jgi:predicted metal-binding membrane protein
VLRLGPHHPADVNRPIEWVARHDRIVVVAALGAVVVLAWGLLLAGTGMEVPDARAGEHPADARSLGRFLAVLLMWAVMMVAMMLPSAAPTILLFAALTRTRASASPLPPTAGFAAGYVLLWGVFSLVATLAHMALEHAALVSSAMRTTTSVLVGLLLVAAGVYQWTPLKHACLTNCRSPIHFVTRHWRAGLGGAFRLGLFHGAYCVGCCWTLMGLLFVGGVMNVAWVAALAVFVLLEKTTFLGTRVGRAVRGVGLVVAGAIALALR